MSCPLNCPVLSSCECHSGLYRPLAFSCLPSFSRPWPVTRWKDGVSLSDVPLISPPLPAHASRNQFKLQPWFHGPPTQRRASLKALARPSRHQDGRDLSFLPCVLLWPHPEPRPFACIRPLLWLGLRGVRRQILEVVKAGKIIWVGQRGKYQGQMQGRPLVVTDLPSSASRAVFERLHVHRM